MWMLIRTFGLLLAAVLLLPASAAMGQEAAEAIFDGKSLAGWNVLPGEKQWWTVAEGALTGGSLQETVPHNTFVATDKSYHNFELNLKIRIQGAGGFVNSGIQIRSIRAPKGSEMIGYQVDAGDGWWGKMYDESRRNKVIAQAEDLKAVNKAVRPGDWNEYRIVAEGPRIRSWINGIAALDYTEKDASIPLNGKIGIQAHGGGKVLVQVKDMTIRELPPTPGAMTWEKAAAAKEKPRPAPQGEAAGEPRSPEQELAGFRIPEGFEVELVAAESEGIGKFVALTFDADGRLWTTTALEYPVDANENPEASRRLFEQGGRDKVLVFDNATAKEVGPPRIFADELVMPLGVLPYKDGAFVQYGSDIRFYRDTDGDGKADTHEVILTGFGTQDSHLFPHQFTRAPGGAILMAQGLFNYSQVRRPDGRPFANGQTQIRFDQCKLARFSPDGAAFEALTAGPNNIWGLTASREGEIWIQEANDIGYPIIPYEPGQLYRTGSPDRLKPYQPLMPPPLGPPQMGGTGLSGLALADDRNGWEYPWGFADAPEDGARQFYVANPITSRIQRIQATPEGERYRYKKLPDLLISEDPKFRPVAIQFGPDGCLYVIDWYNKIISHNEVPRTHPERDKTRGRIWRIRRTGQPYTAPPKLSELTDAELVEHLGDANARIAEFGWQEIVDRQASAMVPQLEQIVQDSNEADDRRLGALWALEGLATVGTPVLKELATEGNANLRREAVRIAAAQPRPSSEFLAVAAPLVEDPSPRVRAAVGDALRRVPADDPAVVALMVELGKASLSGGVWEMYDREFERYLARWAMEENPEVVAELLRSPQGQALPVENRILATLALGGRTAAIELARLLPLLDRPLNQEEVRVLAPHFEEPVVAQQLAQALERAETRAALLRALLEVRTQLDLTRLRPAIERAVTVIWNDIPDQRPLALELIGAFQLRALEDNVLWMVKSAEATAEEKLAGLRALREVETTRHEALAELAMSDESFSVRQAALQALAQTPTNPSAAMVGSLLPELNFEQRTTVIDLLSTHKAGAAELLAGYDAGNVQLDEFTPQVLDSLQALLPQHETLQQVWRQVASQGQSVLQLSGGKDDFVKRPIRLPGPFTVETWVKLRPQIGNMDGILGQSGVLDMNFYDSTFRVWISGQNDVVIADRKMVPDTWTHVAVTRDEAGHFRIYLGGELSAEGRAKNTAEFGNLHIGKTIVANAGTEAQLIEYRVWNRARTSDEIRHAFDRRMQGSSPEGLVQYFAGEDWGELSGQAKVLATLDAPRLLSAEEAQKQDDLFAKYRRLAELSGDLARGKQLFEKNCLSCHQFAGRGGKIGPALDGVGLTGTEAILRNVLTPSAAIEGGYRSYRVLTASGQIVSGLLVSDDSEAVVLRQLNTADQRIPKSNILKAGFTSTSVMPNGLLDPLSDEEVIDLFTYLGSLKQGVDQP